MLDRSSCPASRRIQPHLIRTKDSAVQAEPWTFSLETERMLREKDGRSAWANRCDERAR